MIEELPVVALGCLLHDIGKVIQRADERPMKKSHSKFGGDFLDSADLTTANRAWAWVIESIRNHHWKDIKEGRATLPIAWFAFEGDNLASAHDRRDKQAIKPLFDNNGNRLEETDCSEKWDRFQRLDSIFSNFRTNSDCRSYPTKLPLWFRRTSDNKYVREFYPYPESIDSESDSLQFYQTLRDKVLTPLVEFLKTRDPRCLDSVNSVIHYLEENLSMVPPDTFTGHTNDVSLFDHLKLTAAIGTCMYAYVAENHVEWLSKPGSLIPWDRKFRSKPAYLLVKADLSGIQEFIYNVSSKAALKGLRGRSFYLELLQSHLSDSILSNLGLSRANLLYQGGGGFVLLVPNTKTTVSSLTLTKSKLNQWLFDIHKGRLFMALEWAEATGEQLRASDNEHSMASVWRKLSERVKSAKGEKFRGCLAKVFEMTPYLEECKICHRDDLKLVKLGTENSLEICPLCMELIGIGRSLPDADFNEAGISSELEITDTEGDLGLLPNLMSNSETSRAQMKISFSQKGNRNDNAFVLHNFDLYKPPKLFWSLYEYEDNDFARLAQAADGVKRIAVLRADVDNLGLIFSGLNDDIGLPSELRGLSRDAAVSRSLARFFSHYLDDLLHDANNNSRDGKWAMTTVYAGGDDVFLVGAWNQIIEFAILLHEKFDEYTCGRLTMSAGIAIQKSRYPFYRLAQQAKEAEDNAKAADGKNSLCIRFDDRELENFGFHTFVWDDWYKVIKPLMDTISELEKEVRVSRRFWNDLLSYCRRDDRSLYRLLYNVARKESSLKLLQNDRWNSFKREWIIPLGSDATRKKVRYLETALNWYLLFSSRTEIAKV